VLLRDPGGAVLLGGSVLDIFVKTSKALR
jgi:hypothetical protein